MARSRSFLVVLVAVACSVSAQEAPKRADSAPKFELPAGSPPPPPPGPPRPPGQEPRRDWRDFRENRKPGEAPGRPLEMTPEAQAMREQAQKEFEKMSPEQRQRFWGNFKKPGEAPGGPFELTPEAQAMRDQARKEFEKMTPEQRQRFWGNFKSWMDMPSNQKDYFTKMHDDRFQRARDEIKEVIARSGLELNEDQKKQFTERYFEERKIIEERLRKEMEDHRWPLLAAMEEHLKTEFSKPVDPEKTPEPKKPAESK